MYSKKATVVNEAGMHMLPAQLLTAKAKQFSSRITLHGKEQSADAKNLMGLLALGFEKGTVVTITAEGDDERQAVEALAELFETGFGEP